MGKSTLGRTILRLLPATGGEVFFEGTDILKFKGKDVKKMHLNMQMIFQDPFTSLNPRMSISNIIADPMKNCGIVKTKAEEGRKGTGTDGSLRPAGKVCEYLSA